MKKKPNSTSTDTATRQKDAKAKDLAKLKALKKKCKDFKSRPQFPHQRPGLRSAKNMHRTPTKIANFSKDNTTNNSESDSSNHDRVTVDTANETCQSFSLPTDSQSFQDIAIYLRKTVAELHQSNNNLHTIIAQQKTIIESMNDEIKGCKKRIDFLEAEIDDLRQENLSDKIIITGPDIQNFISRSPERRNNSRTVGLHSLNDLKLLVASKTLPGFPSPDPEPIDSIDTAEMEALIAASRKAEEIALSKLISDQGIVSASIFTDNILCVTLRSRQCAMEILTRNKFTNKALRFTEQLTRNR